jgi:hypothetical protein
MEAIMAAKDLSCAASACSRGSLLLFGKAGLVHFHELVQAFHEARPDWSTSVATTPWLELVSHLVPRTGEVPSAGVLVGAFLRAGNRLCQELG